MKFILNFGLLSYSDKKNQNIQLETFFGFFLYNFLDKLIFCDDFCDSDGSCIAELLFFKLCQKWQIIFQSSFETNADQYWIIPKINCFQESVLIERGGGTDLGLGRQVQNVGLKFSLKKCLTSSEC